MNHGQTKVGKLAPTASLSETKSLLEADMGRHVLPVKDTQRHDATISCLFVPQPHKLPASTGQGGSPHSHSAMPNSRIRWSQAVQTAPRQSLQSHFCQLEAPSSALIFCPYSVLRTLRDDQSVGGVPVQNIPEYVPSKDTCPPKKPRNRTLLLPSLPV